MWYLKLGKTLFISRHTLHQHWYTCPIALPALRNPQHRSLLAVVSATSAPPFRILLQWNFCHPAVNRFTWQTLPNWKQETFLYGCSLHWVLLPKKTQNKTLFFDGTLLKHGRRFDYWNQLPNMRMRVCYLVSHETGLCCCCFIWSLLQAQIWSTRFCLWT
jgi:hypothetical protein